jgi:hypothetical protein
MDLRKYFALSPRSSPKKMRELGHIGCSTPTYASMREPPQAHELNEHSVRVASPHLCHWFGAAFGLLTFSGLVLVLSQSMVWAEDITADNRGWNGLSELLAIAAQEGDTTRPSRVDVSHLSADDGLLIIHPVQPLPTGELAKFMRSGGRVAVADDYGAGARFLATFGMTLRDAEGESVRALRGNPAWPIATPLVAHALTDGVSALVTNHPRVLYHPTLTPVFELSGDLGAVVLSGAVGGGRLVAIADSSVLINNMLEFEGNRQFARDLIRFIRGRGPTARLLIADSATHWEIGTRTFEQPLAQLASALERLSHPQLPPLAIVVLSGALAGLLLSVVATSLPRRSAYGRRAYLQGSECVAGMAGRVSHYASGERSLLSPLLTLKGELEQQAADVLRPATQLQRSELLQGLVAAGLRAELAHELGQFLQVVDRLQDASTIHAKPVTVRHFSELVALGRRILAELDAHSAAAQT